MSRAVSPRGLLRLVALPAALAFVLVFLGTLAVLDDDDEPGTRSATESTPASADSTLPAATGDERLVAALGEVEAPPESELAELPLDATSLRAITKPPRGGRRSMDIWPDVSPDGTTLVFTRLGEGSPPRTYLVGMDGSGLRPLMRARRVELTPAWSPDGLRIAFARDDGGEGALYVVKPDGTGLTRLAGTPGVYYDAPTWSPDGSHIVFHRFDNDNEDLHVIRADGSGETELVGGSHDDSMPAWSPDGERIAFARDGQIAVVNVDGSDLRVLTSGEKLHSDPRWSPDGERIAFIQDPGTLLVIGADGTRLARVPIAGRAFGVDWMPGS